MRRKISTIVISVIATVVLSLGLFACATKVENVNLSFIVDGQAIATIETSGKDVVAIPNNPEKEGYTFEGWYWDKDIWRNPFTTNSLLNAPISSNMNVYAKMTAIQYSITYNLDGGTSTNPLFYTIESSTITLADAEKEGYTFDGWYNEANFTNKVTSVNKGSMGNVELYAKFSINQYTISFNSDGGNEVEGITKDYGTTVTAPTAPTKSGYDFSGWYEAGSETAYIFSTIPAKDISLKAKWTATEYSITYNLGGGVNGENPAKYTIETNTVILSSATRDGYTFGGWYQGEDKVEKIESGSMGDVSLTAHWTPIEYTITYENTKSEENSNPVKFTIESETITLVGLEKLGYIFNGWYNASNKITEIATGTIGNITLTANWTVNGYEITYHNVDGAAINNPDVYNVEDEPLTLADASKAGYIFRGWYTDADFNTKIEVISLGTIGDKDIYADWEIIEYTITYVYDDTQGDLTTGDSLKTVYTVEDEFDFTILECSIVGYEFSGWYTEKVLGTGTKYSGIGLGTIGDKTFYAQWSPAVYTITYHNVDNVTNTNPTTYTIESEDFSISNISQVGYTFDGWYSDRELQNAATTNIVKGSHGSIEFYAKWTAIIYSITYNLYGGVYSGNENLTSYIIEDNITLINPIQDGKYFVGWYTLSENGDLITVINGTTGNITLNARWIAFDSKGGSSVNYDLTFSQSGIQAPADPTKDYYDFAGWFFDEQYVNEYNFNSLPSTNSTLYAKWVATDYTITYVMNGGTNNSGNPSTYTVEDAVTFLQPSKVGYTFNGWYSNESFTSALVTEIPIGSHGNITIYANFGINQYTISFESNGGTSVDDITQNYATSVSAPANPSKIGYTFGGWYIDSALKNAYTFTTIPAYNFTLYAKWNLVDYRITYNLDGGTNSANNPNTYTIERATFGLSAPTKRGYTFDGWYEDSAYSQAITQIDSGSYGDIELFVKWQIITYTITYIVPDNTVNDNLIEYTVITNITQLSDAALRGYTFNGWYANEQYSEAVSRIGGGNIGNITLYGKFTANKYNVWLDGNEQASCVVSFNLNGASGTAPATQNITEVNTLKYPTIPRRAGYLFCGWYSNSNCDGEPYDFSALVGGDITLYAKWVAIGDALVININSTLTTALNGTREKVFRFIPLTSGNVSITTAGSIDTLGSLYKGETLLKIDDDSGSESNFLIVYNVTAGEVYDIHVRGFSSSTSGSITLSLTGVATIAEGGYTKSGNKSEATYDSSFKLPIPEAEGNYKFLGWQDVNGVLYTDAQGNSIINWNKAEDSVLYSKWEKMEYTVTFVSNGGSSVDAVTLEYGARLDLNRYVTTRSGYTFSGWYLSASDSEPYSAGTMPDHNITLYAKWTTFALGTIKYDVDKKAISVNDTVNAELFNAICLDTDGKPAAFTFTVNGTQVAGNTISIRLVATSGNKTKQVTISDVKVYGMPTLTIDKTNVKYINIVGGLTAEWFGASGVDTFGEATSIQVAIADGYGSGDVGTIVIKSIDPAGNETVEMMENIEIYDLPTITYDPNKNAVSMYDVSRNGFYAKLFDAIAKDSFGKSTYITVDYSNDSVDYSNEYTYRTTTKNFDNFFAATNTGTYRLYYKNGSSGARTYLSIYCITTNSVVLSESYYTNTSYSSKSFDVVSGYEYRVSTRAYGSSYTTNFTMYLTAYDNAAANRVLFGNTINITLRAIDSKGNTASVSFEVNVYRSPQLSNASITEFNESDEITAVTLGISANDCFGNALDVSLDIKSGQQVGGETMIVTATTIDAANNIVQNDIDIKIYGTPTITYSRTGIKISEDPTVSGDVAIDLGTKAVDSFGNELNTTVTLKSGNYQAGNYVIYTLTAIDKIGNICEIDTAPIGIYDISDINFTYSNMSSDLIKLFSKGEEFFATATDTFGNACDITIVPADGFELKGGEIIDLYIVATDNAGNSVSSELISGIKVYDIPTVKCIYGNVIYSDMQLTEFAFIVLDSFGEELVFTMSLSGDIIAGEEITVVFDATDDAGNDVPMLVLYVISPSDFVFEAYGDGFAVTAYNGDSNDVLIPQFHNGKSVVAIGENAFKNQTQVRNVIVPDSVTGIASGAFYGCSNLMSVIIPNSVSVIEYNVFSGCGWLTIYCEAASKPSGWGDGWNSSCPIIWDYKNNDKDSYGYVYVVVDGIRYRLKDSVATVIEQPHNISGDKTIYTRVTYKNESYNVTSIRDGAFYGCSGLTSVVIPNSVTSIGNSTFYGCIGLTSVVISNSVTSIGNSTFYGCSGLMSVVIPNSVTNIGSNAFYGCIGLTSVVIPNSVTSIEMGAFARCSSLMSITIPFVGGKKDSNTYFGFIFGADNSNNNGNYVPVSLKNVIITGGESIGNFAFSNCSRLTSIEIPNSVTIIGGNAFYYCSNLQNLEIPSSVTSIGSYAFSNCSSLSSIEIPNSVTSIWSYAFEFCRGLTSIIIPKSVTSIGYNAFNYCSSLIIYCEATSKPNGWNIDWNYFSHPVVWDYKNNDKDSDGYAYAVVDGIRYRLKDEVATVIEQLPDISGAKTIQSSVSYRNEIYCVTGIGNNAFYGRSGLTSVVIPNSVISIGSSAFNGCSSLTSIVIPNSVASIRNSAFYGCDVLIIYCEAESKPSGWDSTWNSSCPVVWDCKNTDRDEKGYAYAVIDGVRYRLKDGHATVISQSSIVSGAIIIPSSVSYNSAIYSVTNIADEAFKNCYSLRSIEIPNSVTSIGSRAFYNCTSLQSVTLPNALKNIQSNTFYNCRNLSHIELPISLTSIEPEVFQYCSSLTSIVIPDSVTSIGGDAFIGCSSLTIYCEIANVPSGWVSGTFNWNPSGCPVILNCKTNDKDYSGYVYTVIDGIRYRLKDGSAILIRQPSNISGAKIILSSLLYKNVTYSVTSITSEAFLGCTKLTSIEIPNSITFIGSGAFSGCSNLESISLPFVGSSATATTASSTTLFGYIFGTNSYTGGTSTNQYYANAKFTSYYIPISLKSVTITGNNIFYGAFYNCNNITNIILGNDVTSIGYRAFYNCNSLRGALFINATGWWYTNLTTATSGTSILSSELSSFDTAAICLTSTYCDYRWGKDV